MIKNVNLKPFEVSYKFPTYVYGNDIESYTLIATVHEHYKIILGKLTIGTSESGSATLSHALFESYPEYGEKMSESKIRIGGFESDFMAAKNVMVKTGIEFENIAPCHFCDLLSALGAYYQAANHEISDYVVMSQKCH